MLISKAEVEAMMCYGILASLREIIYIIRRTSGHVEVADTAFEYLNI
jgi:hypothetical protein